MQQLLVDPGAIAMELAGASGADRDLAQYRLALELSQAIEDYAPSRYPTRPIELEGLSLDAMREACAKSASYAYIFGCWRAVVTDLEAQNAQRLGVLISTTAGPRVAMFAVARASWSPA